MKKDDLVIYHRKYGKRDFYKNYFVIDAVIDDTIVATECWLNYNDMHTVEQAQCVFTKRANGRFYRKGDGMQQHEQCGLWLVTDVDTHCEDIGYRLDKATADYRHKVATFKVWRQRKGDWNAYYKRSIQARLSTYNKRMDEELAKDIAKLHDRQDLLVTYEQQYQDWSDGKHKDAFYKKFGTTDDAMIEKDFERLLRHARQNIKWNHVDVQKYEKAKAMHGAFDRNNYTLWEAA